MRKWRNQVRGFGEKKVVCFVVRGVERKLVEKDEGERQRERESQFGVRGTKRKGKVGRRNEGGLEWRQDGRKEA